MHCQQALFTTFVKPLLCYHGPRARAKRMFGDRTLRDHKRAGSRLEDGHAVERFWINWLPEHARQKQNATSIPLRQWQIEPSYAIDVHGPFAYRRMMALFLLPHPPTSRVLSRIVYQSRLHLQPFVDIPTVPHYSAKCAKDCHDPVSHKQIHRTLRKNGEKDVKQTTDDQLHAFLKRKRKLFSRLSVWFLSSCH